MALNLGTHWTLYSTLLAMMSQGTNQGQSPIGNEIHEGHMNDDKRKQGQTWMIRAAIPCQAIKGSQETHYISINTLTSL